MNEAFPDSLNAIRDALNQPDATQQLVEIIRAHPQNSTIGDIVVIYFELVEQSPSQVNKLTATLVNLKNSAEVTAIAAYDRLGKPEQRPIALALDLELHELLRGVLVLNFDPITPSNELLIASLLSAVVTKHSLCHSRALSAAVRRGLYYDVYDVAAHQVKLSFLEHAFSSL